MILLKKKWNQRFKCQQINEEGAHTYLAARIFLDVSKRSLSAEGIWREMLSLT